MNLGRVTKLNLHRYPQEDFILTKETCDYTLGEKLYQALHSYNLATTARDSAQVNQATINLHVVLMEVINLEIDEPEQCFYDIVGITQVKNTRQFVELNVYVRELE